MTSEHPMSNEMTPPAASSAGRRAASASSCLITPQAMVEQPIPSTMTGPHRRRKRRRAAAAVLPLAAFAAGCLLLDNSLGGRATSLRRRQLLASISEAGLLEKLDAEEARAAALHDNRDDKDENDSGSHHSPRGALAPYTVRDAVAESHVWDHTFAVLVYDPDIDGFIGYHSQHHKWNASGKKLWGSMSVLSSMLRKTFPERFTKNSEEFAVAIGSGDYPHVKIGQLPHAGGVAPVLMFGSAFRDATLYPNLIKMPMPGMHLGCFEEFSRTGHVCGGFRAMRGGAPHGELVFGKEFGLAWEDLIPQVIWRGTDFGYLPTLFRPKHSAPLDNYLEHIVEERKAAAGDEAEKKRAATEALRENYDRLLPRWKGAVLTAEAEVDAESDESNHTKLPWANIKFSRHMHNGMMAPTKGSSKYRTYDELGIATGDFLARTDVAKYKYHIDLGGGGGTTWTGTVEKLAMPGLLFHHVTPTMDYIHDIMKPWRHYVPVASDLSDLKDKFEWAERYPDEAQRIAERATERVRSLGTEEGFGALFEEVFREPMRRTIEAYRPGANWKEVLEEGGMAPVMRCSGVSNNPASCHSVGGDAGAASPKRGMHAGQMPLFVERHTN